MQFLNRKEGMCLLFHQAAMLIRRLWRGCVLPSDGGLLLFQTMEAFTAKCQYRLIFNISRGIKGNRASGYARRASDARIPS